MKVDLFSLPARSIPIAVTTTASASTPLPGTGTTLRVVNEGPNIAFVALSTTAAVATLPNAVPTNTSIPVIVGDTTFTIPNDQIYNISAICRATQSAQLTVQVGEGQ